MKTESLILKLAGGYNLIWGSVVILFPYLFFDALGIVRPSPIEIWQCIGMIVGVYGVGYWISARDPERHWPIIFVGFLGKIFGPIGFIQALIQGVFPLRFLWVILFNDLIWWIPFFYILRKHSAFSRFLKGQV